MFNKWKLEAEVTAALINFSARLEKETIERLHADYLACPANIENARVTVKPGRKYAKVIVGSGVRYFISLTTGNIYASAGRNAPNRNRFFGTLWTVDDFNWGEYEARAKPGTNWEMVPVAGGSGYMTAVMK